MIAEAFRRSDEFDDLISDFFRCSSRSIQIPGWTVQHFSVRRSYFESLSTNGFCLDRSPWALSKDALWERERVRASCASSSTVRFPRARRSACRQDWTLKSKCGTLNRPRRWI